MSCLLTGVVAVTGCTSSGPVDSSSKAASYRVGTYRSYIHGTVANTFRATNIALDQLGYFRTEQLRTENRSVVFARVQGDEKIRVSLVPTIDGYTEVSISYGRYGDQKESQKIFLKIREISQALGAGG
jgi:hypothetical protein